MTANGMFGSKRLRLYGMRSPRTLWTTDETWYRQNLITGVVMIGVGIAWIAVIGARAFMI